MRLPDENIVNDEDGAFEDLLIAFLDHSEGDNTEQPESTSEQINDPSRTQLDIMRCTEELSSEPCPEIQMNTRCIEKNKHKTRILPGQLNK